jgi:RNA polymerase sigma-70 factor (ECF subfamily)
MTPQAILIGAAVAGDDRAFAALVEPLRRPIGNRLRRMLRDAELAQDLWQDTLIRVHQHLRFFDPKNRSQFSSWVTRIAINLAINAIRDAKRRSRVVLASDLDQDPNLAGVIEQAADPTSGPERLFRGRELDARIQEALDNLTVDHREVFVLRFMRGKSYQAIADTTHASIGTVKSRLHRARTMLAAALAEERVA